jgi:hypothetical protein
VGIKEAHPNPALIAGACSRLLFNIVPIAERLFDKLCGSLDTNKNTYFGNKKYIFHPIYL